MVLHSTMNISAIGDSTDKHIKMGGGGDSTDKHSKMGGGTLQTNTVKWGGLYNQTQYNDNGERGDIGTLNNIFPPYKSISYRNSIFCSSKETQL